jgi:hypothetical protein
VRVRSLVCVRVRGTLVRLRIWKENQLDKEVWQVIDKTVGASEL